MFKTLNPMNREKLKAQLHRLIDEIESEVVLENFLEAISDFRSRKSDILDDLSDIQKNRLDGAIKQIKEGKTISHADMKTAVNQWLTK